MYLITIGRESEEAVNSHGSEWQKTQKAEKLLLFSFFYHQYWAPKACSPFPKVTPGSTDP